MVMIRLTLTVVVCLLTETFFFAAAYTSSLQAAENEFIQASWDSHRKKDEIADASSSSVADLVATGLQLFGAELAVFAVTLCFAIALRSPKAVKRSAPQSFRDAPSSTATGAGTAVAETTIALHEEKPQQQQQQQLQRFFEKPVSCSITSGNSRRHLETPPALGVQTSSWLSSRQVEVARLLDQIVDSVRANPNVRTACRALELYQEMRSLIKKSGDQDGGALLLLSEAAWHSRSSAFDLYNSLMQCAVRTSQCHLVERLLDDMLAQGVCRPLSFYESVMKQLAGQKHYQLALNVYDRLTADGLRASAVTFSCLVSFATEIGDYDRAVVFFNQLAEQSTPSIRAYMTILRVHNKRQDWACSLQIYRQMQEKKAMIDSLVLNVVLSTGVAADKVEEVNALLLEGSAARPKVVDTVSYNTLIKGFLQRNDLCSALGCLERMKADAIKPNCITFNTIMERAMRSFQEDAAWLLYEKMQESAVKPDKVTCSILIKGLGRKPPRAHLESALSLLEQARSFPGGGCGDALFLSSMQTLVTDAVVRSGEGDLLRD